MTCPVCGGKTRIVNYCATTEEIYRRRECVECEHIFYTTESESDRDVFRQAMIEKHPSYTRPYKKDFVKL